MSRGSYYKTMDANRRKNFQAWLVVTNRRINKINLVTGDYYCYCLAYRGRNHRIVLQEMSKTIASGMIQISAALTLIEERFKNELEKVARSNNGDSH